MARYSANSEMPPSKRNEVSLSLLVRARRGRRSRAPARGRRSGARAARAPRGERRILREDLPVGPVADAGAGDALRGAARRRAARMRFSKGVNGESGGARPFGEDAGLAAVERHRPGLAAAVDLDVEPLRERVDDGRADAVQAAGGRVRPAAELAAGVQLGEDDLDAGQPGARLDVDRDAARRVSRTSTLPSACRTTSMRVPWPAERLVDGVVDDLPEAVHEPAGVGRADVHARALADRFESLEHLQVVGGILGGHNPQEYPRARRAPCTDTRRRDPRTRSAKCHRFAAFSKQTRGCM